MSMPGDIDSRIREFLSSADILNRLQTLERFKEQASADLTTKTRAIESLTIKATELTKSLSDKSALLDKTITDVYNLASYTRDIASKAESAVKDAKDALSNAEASLTKAAEAVQYAYDALESSKYAFNKAIEEGRESWNIAVDTINGIKQWFNSLVDKINLIVSDITNTSNILSGQLGYVTGEITWVSSLNPLVNPGRFVDHTKNAFNGLKDMCDTLNSFIQMLKMRGQEIASSPPLLPDKTRK